MSALAIGETATNNSIFVIKQYKWEGLWVFDDANVGLVKEPFVGGADTMIDVATASFRHRQPPAIQGSDWVVKSLEAALWAFLDADSFEAAVLRAVNLGDDADTTGAICGQLAGAIWGESQIPGSLRVTERLKTSHRLAPQNPPGV